MDPDLIFLVNYSCPRCQAALEARVAGVVPWLRCPACGRPSLPPEHNRTVPSWSADDKTMLIGSFTTGGALASASTTQAPHNPFRPMVPLPPPRSLPAVPRANLILGSFLFLSTILFVFSLLESSRERSVIFGLGAAVCLVLLVKQRPKGSSPY